MSDSVCYKCRNTFPPGSMVSSYENRSYHPHCLTCRMCNRSVSGQKFFKDDYGNLICQACESKNDLKCNKCYRSVEPGEKYKTLDDGTVYHNDCFTCSGPCRKPLGTKFYDAGNGKYICVDCHDRHSVRRQDDDVSYSRKPIVEGVRGTRPPEPRYESNTRSVYSRYEDPNDGGVRELSSTFTTKLTTSDSRDEPSKPSTYRPSTSYKTRDNPQTEPEKNYSNEKIICEKCGREIKEGTYSVYNEKPYHAKCFKCSRCKNELKDLKFFKVDGEPVCRDCNEKELLSKASKCHKCKKPILETVIKFQNEEYHEHCLTCTSCNALLKDNSIYTNKQGLPYCTDCYTRKEAKKCEKCRKPIPPNEKNVVFEDKPYHQQCFTCDQCGHQIYSNESFAKRDKAIICRYCARN